MKIMNKDEFIKELENRLELLEKEKRNAVIKKYKTTITKRINNKESEEDIIVSFGDIELLSNNILRDHGVKKEVKNKKGEKTTQIDKDFFGDFITTVKEILDTITKKDYKTILLIVGELLLIIIAVCLLKIPFILGRELLLNLYDSIGIGFASRQSEITATLIDLGYIVFAVFVFIHLFTTRFKKYVVDKKKKK